MKRRNQPAGRRQAASERPSADGNTRTRSPAESGRPEQPADPNPESTPQPQSAANAVDRIIAEVRRGAGRPAELTPETLRSIVTALYLGAYLETAAAHAGISPRTLRDWIRRGVKAKRRARKLKQSGIVVTDDEKMRARRDAPYVEISAAVEKAQAAADLRDIGNVARAAGSGTWTASAWRLERKHPDQWGQRHRIETSGPGGGPISVATTVIPAERLKDLTDEELGALEAIAARLSGDSKP